MLRSEDAASATSSWEKGGGTGRSVERIRGNLLIRRLGDPAQRICENFVNGPWLNLLKSPRGRFLGEIAEVKRGITSGCDAFFMPRDVTETILAKLADGLPWNDIGLMASCKRSEVESGKVRIVRAGDNTLHPIEAQYLRPEVHSLMQVDRPVIRTSNLDRVVLWVSDPLNTLGHTYVAKYIRWGAKQTFASKKSKAVPVPQRSTCASRSVWYDLTSDKVGVAFWPKAQKYRHIIPANPEKLVCNCNLYTVVPDLADEDERIALAAILNSTLVGLFKCFYGRYAGSEGTLKTEVADTVLLEVPDPREVSPELAGRLKKALDKMTQRDVTHLVEDALLECHSEEGMREILHKSPELPKELHQSDRRELDDCVLDLIGVSNRSTRQELLEELYLVTTEYYRYQRTQDIQSSEDRAGGKSRQLGPQDLAESIWASLGDEDKGPPILEWIVQSFPATVRINIPEGKAAAIGIGDMFNPTAVLFGSHKPSQISYSSPEQAELVVELSKLGLNGEVNVPKAASHSQQCLQHIRSRLSQAEERFSDLAGSRTGSQSMREKVADLLFHWYTHGRSA
jgi:hypothetical protein